jgi:hydrogenase maturation protease
MSLTTARYLILACGNTLRGDDGIGPFLAAWAEERFSADSSIRVISRQQWTPELAEEISTAESVLFIDCSMDSAPGSVQVFPIKPATTAEGLGTHHLGAPELLALCRDLFDAQPRNANLLTVGAGSLDLSEQLSPAVTAALPEAYRLLEESIRH